MPRLTAAQRTARERILLAAARGLGPEALAAALTEALALAIPHNGYRLFAVDPRTLLVNRLLAASPEDAWARLEWLREVYLHEQLAYIRHDELMRRELRAVAFQELPELSWGYPAELLASEPPGEHRARFHAMQSPSGGTMIVSLPAGGRWVAVLYLYHRTGRPSFRAQDIVFARQIAPLCGEAIRAALDRERATVNRDDGPDVAGVLLLGATDEIVFATPAGEEWLRRLLGTEAGRREALPTAVRAAMAALRAGGVTGRVIAETERGPVRVEATPSGRTDQVAVALLPVARAAPAHPPAEWALTPAERSVCTHLLHGESNRRIAARLVISERTVEAHLRRVYEKAGVSTRAQLLARYFRATMPPGLVDERGPGEEA